MKLGQTRKFMIFHQSQCILATKTNVKTYDEMKRKIDIATLSGTQGANESKKEKTNTVSFTQMKISSIKDTNHILSTLFIQWNCSNTVTLFDARIHANM